MNEGKIHSIFWLSNIQELLAENSILRHALKNLQSKIIRVEELTQIHDYWMIQPDNIMIPSVNKLKNVTDAMKAYRAKVLTPNKF